MQLGKVANPYLNKYLNIRAKILKDLVLEKDTRDTLYNALYKQQVRLLIIEIKNLNRDFSKVNYHTEQYNQKAVYKQIQISILRLFANLENKAPRKEKGEPNY